MKGFQHASRHYDGLRVELHVARHVQTNAGELLQVFGLRVDGSHGFGQVEGPETALVQLARFILDTFEVPTAPTVVRVELVPPAAPPAPAAIAHQVDELAGEKASLLRSVR